eukprot:1160133-Pelagomonas_calceolata.AAC.3
MSEGMSILVQAHSPAMQAAGAWGGEQLLRAGAASGPHTPATAVATAWCVRACACAFLDQISADLTKHIEVWRLGAGQL